MNSASIARWIQYAHLDKLYGHLPGMTKALPAHFRPGSSRVCRHDGGWPSARGTPRTNYY
jgi:hypothetical protein